MMEAMQMDLDLGGGGEVKTVALGKLTSLVSSGSTPLGGAKIYLDQGPVMLIRSQNVLMRELSLDDVAFITDDVAGKMQRTVVQPNDVLLNITGASIGRVSTFELSCQANVNQHVCIIRVIPELLSHRYLMHFLAQPSFQAHIDSSQHGGTRQALTFPQIRDFQIPLPPLTEQKRIAAILDKADRIRQKRKETIRLTEELLRSAFLEMFGDPVTNPKGWEVKPLQSFGSIVTGNTPPRDNPENYGSYIEWIKSDNITTPEHFLTSAEEYLSQKGAKLGRIVTKGAVLVTCIAGSPSSIGKAAIADRGVAFNQQINAVIPSDDVSSAFLYAHFLVAQHLIQAQSTNSMKGMVSKGKLSSVEFMKPPKAKQERFDAWFKTFYDLYQRLKKDSLLSENLFNALLQRAFKGQL
jgi:type I restriction enzyme, S subunit